MATLLISAAINIAIGLAINALFPPPDIEQEGPRLADLGFTSAAYGKFINIPFGTDRMDGNIIDTTDPAIEEVVNQESTEVGKGGGQTVNTTTYTYFLTCRIAFCIEGASDLIRLWGDGKVVYDTTSTSQFIKSGWSVTFYRGGVNQLQDPEEVSRRGSNIPAYGHLTTVKLDRVPLADFGNRIPNFTAEIAFASQSNVPFDNMAEPAGLDVPGSLSGADFSHMSLNPLRDEFYSLKTGGDSSWTGTLSSMDFKFLFGTGGFSEPTVAWNGFAYHQTGFSNAGPLNKKDIETGEIVATLGGSGLGLTDVLSPPNFGNSGYWDFVQLTIPGVGVKTMLFHACNFGTANGSFVDGDNLASLYVTSTADGFPADQLTDTTVSIPDHDRGVMYLISNDVANSRYRVIAATPDFIIGVGGASQVAPSVTVHDDIPYASWPSGTGNIQGWAVNRNTGDLMMSNGSSMILYNPAAKTILATRTNAQGVTGFVGRNNYYTSSVFGWMHGSTVGSASRLYVIDTRTLATIREDNNIGSLIGWQGSDSVLHDPSQVWDDRTQAIVFSRVDVGSGAVNPNRILKVFVNRVTGLGVGLDFVVKSLSTSYQRQVMAGLEDSDIDVTTLAGESVLGYTINRKSTMKSALEPLRMRYQFDAIQSDWKMKFPVRGQSPVTTIPEEFVGLLKRGADQNDEPHIREVRADDLSLPMRLGIRYKNKNADYQIDMETDKRHLFPNPTMRSKSDRTIDVPLVDTPTNMKQTAQEHLLTIWNERISYKTIIPWTYIKLDPTDVFNLGAFSETHQLRMLENNLGHGWSIEITGVVEDTAQYTSVLGGGSNLGHITPTIPSGLPTRLFPLDAPLLSAADLLLTPISNAYMAVGAFESSWPGATISKSLDNVDYQTTGSVNSEAASAKVQTPPGAWVDSNGDFPNRIQEVADGGSMTITALRRPEFWASATETNMLAGANHIAVVGETDGEVEVIGYVDVVDNGDNTYTLQRLLRGRLGTEDVTNGGMNVGDVVIGLSDSTNVKESGPIARQRLPVTELDVELFFRGVTIGTPATDADPISFTYTGRDLKPYRPAQIAASPDGSGGLDIDWERRTRGPLQGEWLDLVGTVPLNETIEQYEVTLNTVGAGDFITKVVNDVTTVNFSAAEVALGGTSGGFGPETNWATPDANFPTGIDPDSAGNWTLHQGGVTDFATITSGVVPSGPPPENTASTGYLMYRVSNSSTVTHAMRHDVNIATDLGIDLNSLPDATFFMHFWAAQDRADGGIRVRVEQKNAGGTTLASMDTGERDTGTPYGQWIKYGSEPGQDFGGVPLSMAGVAGAVTLRVIVYCFKRGTLFSTDRSYYDEMTLEVVVPPPGITAKVVQVSETGKKSPIAARQVT